MTAENNENKPYSDMTTGEREQVWSGVYIGPNSLACRIVAGKKQLWGYMYIRRCSSVDVSIYIPTSGISADRNRGKMILHNSRVSKLDVLRRRIGEVCWKRFGDFGWTLQGGMDGDLHHFSNSILIQDFDDSDLRVGTTLEEIAVVVSQKFEKSMAGIGHNWTLEPLNREELNLEAL